MTPVLGLHSLTTLTHAGPFCKNGGKFYNSFHLSLILKPEPCTEDGKLCCLLWLEHSPPHSITSSPAFCTSLPKLDCPETGAVDQNGLKIHFIFFSCSPCSFSLYIFIQVNTSNHTTESTPGYLEISSASGINPKLFSLASGRLFRQGQKAVTFSPKIS